MTTWFTASGQSYAQLFAQRCIENGISFTICSYGTVSSVRYFRHESDFPDDTLLFGSKDAYDWIKRYIQQVITAPVTKLRLWTCPQCKCRESHPMSGKELTEGIIPWWCRGCGTKMELEE